MHRAVWIIALTTCASGCPALDVSQPISLMPDDDWTQDQRQALASAGECWNLEFGTQISTDDATVGQQVRFSFSDFVCTYSQGRTEPNLPVEVRLCRQWFTPDRVPSYYFFHVVLHELGHVLNIKLHTSDSHSVMSTGEAFILGGGRLYGFSAADRQAFREANPDFTPTPSCADVQIGSVDYRQYSCSCF